MAYISFQPSDYFNTKLYTGTGSSNAITGVGFQPDWVWIKDRSSAQNHALYDSVRGVQKKISSSTTGAEATSTTELSAFGSDGFTVLTDGQVNASGDNYVSWNWKAGTTSGITTNSDTSITPSAYSFNQTSGFSMVEYTGTAVDGAYLPHGLGKAPELLFLKQTSGTEPWQVYSKPTGYGGRGWLNTNDAFQTSRGEWYSTNPDSVNMRISNDSHINASGQTFIAYFFTSIQGYSKIGSYKGNGNADGTFIYTGHKPAMVIAKKTSGTSDWIIWDDKRDGYNETIKRVYPNESAAEESTTTQGIDFLSNGFKLRGTSSNAWNSGNDTYIYMSFASEPLVSSNGDPATGF
jgi:hypothetical protein